MTNRAVAKLGGIVALALVLINFSLSGVLASEPQIESDVKQTSQDGLLTYDDPRFDFSISYPSDWRVNEREDDSFTESEVLSFTGTETAGFTPAVYVGHYLIDIEDDTSLQEWVSRYPRALPMDVASSYATEIDGHEAYFVSGESEKTKFQYLNIRSGEMVWFVWANFNESSDQVYSGVFESMAVSLRLGAGLTQRLQDIYGELFEPLPLPLEVLPLPLGSSRIEQDRMVNFMSMNSGQWYVPVYGNWTVRCGSGAHSWGAYYAADIDAHQYTPVYASNGGYVLFAGWNNQGYGNLIKLDTSGYYHYYGHLQSINLAGFTNGEYAADNALIGEVGGTGGDEGAGVDVHLHFHVQTGSSTQSNATGVNLSGFLVGFTANSNYPNIWAACGSTSR